MPRPKKMSPLVAYRIDNGLTQMGLAQKLKVSQACIASWELGRRLPGKNKLLMLEKRLGIPREQLRPDLYGRIRLP